MNHLLFVIRTAATDLSSLLFLHMKRALFACFSKALASVILFIFLWTYEIFMKEESCTLGTVSMSCSCKDDFQTDEVLLKVLVFTLYKESLKYILSLFFLGDSLLVALGFS